MPDRPLHLDPEELDLWLDGRLPDHRTSHLETCDPCRLAAEETRELVDHLARLPHPAPGPLFADRVVAGLQRAPAAAHLQVEELDLWVEGTLPAARAVHLRGCAECQAVANAERLLVLRLEQLPLFDPTPGFTDRVLDRVDLPVTSALGAWLEWRRRLDRNPAAAGIAASVAVLLGGSMAASAAWAAGNQDVITGLGGWLMLQGEQWFWAGVAGLQAQPWYGSIRGMLTPGRAVVAFAALSAVYAAGIMTLRRLIALPGSQVARAVS
jgi:hypothetical protein